MIDRRLLPVVIGVLVLSGVATLVRAARQHVRGRYLSGGILIADVGGYDVHTAFLLGSLFRSIASDIAAHTSPSARILEVGCGPGHLTMRLARDHGLDVTGLDLDPAMIERARAKAERSPADKGRRPSFIVGNAADMTIGDASFDLVVSTLSMHHWSDPVGGLAEIARVLRPGGRALIWDLKAGAIPFHAHALDPAAHVHASPLRLVSNTPWRWPWRLRFLRRLELVHA